MEKGGSTIIYPELSYKIMSLVFEVHNKLGNKWREVDFCNAFETLLIREGLKYEREKKLDLEFEGRKFANCRLDFVIEEKIVLEFKKVWKITDNEIKQSLRYLDVTGLKLVIIINFKHKRIEYRRVVNPFYH